MTPEEEQAIHDEAEKRRMPEPKPVPAPTPPKPKPKPWWDLSRDTDKQSTMEQMLRRGEGVKRKIEDMEK